VDNATVMTAARLGALFNVDPITLLDCDRDTWLIRLACAKVVARDREEEAKKIKAGRG
jgi:hypothetical protein